MQLLGLRAAQIEDVLAQAGQPRFRGRQVAEWVYKRGATGFSEMTNLSRDLRCALEAEHQIAFPEVDSRFDSRDGSTKYLLRLQDGETIETVRLPYPDRVSVCVSSQAGCAMGCTFCATGLGGFRRNLTTGEIIAQPLLAMREHSQNGEKVPTHIVFMGMGEPLLNFRNVRDTVELMHEELGIPMRHITVSTVGILDGIARLAQEKWQLTLAISLHAPNDELRHRLIPTSRKTKVAEIVQAARDYVRVTGRRVTWEYVVLGGVNDQAVHARELALLCKGWPCHVNLIPWNAVPDASLESEPFASPAPNDLRQFRSTLERAGVTVTQRTQRGADVAGACGQLRALHTPQPTFQPQSALMQLPVVA
jgi:23S rRNA (adenine2503-C2)-methyltransferase